MHESVDTPDMANHQFDVNIDEVIDIYQSTRLVLDHRIQDLFAIFETVQIIIE